MALTALRLGINVNAEALSLTLTKTMDHNSEERERGRESPIAIEGFILPFFKQFTQSDLRKKEQESIFSTIPFI